MATAVLDGSRYRRSVSGVTLVIALPITSMLVGAKYLTNDDAAMAAMADGSYTGQPTHQIPFVGRSIGLLLRAAYELDAEITWYPLLMSLLCGVGLLLMLDALRRSLDGVDATRRRLALVPFVLAVPFFCWNISFTLTGFILSGGAIAQLIAWWSNEADHQALDGHRRFLGITLLPALLGAVFGLGAAIRFNSAVGSLVIAVPLLAVAAFRLPRRIRYGVSAAVGVAAVWVVDLGARAIVARQSPEFNSWLEYNEIRGGLHGTNRLAAGLGPQQLAALGWGESEKVLFSRFSYDDPTVFGYDVIAQLNRIVPVAPSEQGLWGSLEGALSNTPTLWLIIIVVCTLLARVGPRWYGSLVWVWWLVVVSGLGWFVRAPRRVTVPLAVLTAVIAIVGGAVAQRREPPQEQSHDDVADPPEHAPHIARRRSAWALTAVLLIALPGMGVVSSHRAAAELESLYSSQLELIEDFPPDTLFIGTGGAFTTEGPDAFGSPDEVISNRVLLMGWPTFSPAYERRKQMMGIADTFEDLAVRSDVFYVTQRSGMINALREYYPKYRGDDVYFRPVSNFKGWRVWSGIYERLR